jgi:hypothetical protein
MAAGAFNGFKDLLVAGAAAEIAGKGFADVVARGAFDAIQQCAGRQQDAGRAVATLRGAEVRERLLQRIQPPVAREAFDRRDRAAAAFDGERQAGEHRFAIHEHRAGAALTELAAVLRAGEPQILAEHFEQRLVSGARDIDRIAIHHAREVRLRASARL